MSFDISKYPALYGSLKQGMNMQRLATQPVSLPPLNLMNFTDNTNRFSTSLVNNVDALGNVLPFGQFGLGTGNTQLNIQQQQVQGSQVNTAKSEEEKQKDKIEEEKKKLQEQQKNLQLGQNIGNTTSFITDSFLKPYNMSQQSSTTNALDSLWSIGANNAESIGNFFGGEAGAKIGAGVGVGMKIADFGANVIKAAGVHTDGMTGFDKFGDSTLGMLTGVGLINAIGAKRADTFSIDRQLQERMGGSYSGTYQDFASTAEKSGKSYGLLSSGARHDANGEIATAKQNQLKIAGISRNARDRQSIVNNTSGLLATNYAFNLNGGYDQRFMRAAKEGGIISRIKKIDFKKSGGQIHNVINLDTKEVEWVPVILPPEEETVEVFKEGGQFSWNYNDWEPEIVQSEWEPEIIDELPTFKEGGAIEEEWQPVIIESFKEGGKTEENDETQVDTTQKNVIPEGALHARKHHMDNDEHITKKGIPVIDNDGSQQAEIELNEIIFSLEVTKKIEEYYKDGSDEAAIACGKLLVEQILNNTEDRTGLIDSLKQGGRIDGCS